MPEVVRALFASLKTLRDDDEVKEERRSALDFTAARLVAALARFCTDGNALVPAQRALLLLASRPEHKAESISHIVDALRRIDANTSKDAGYSRLLESALDAGASINAQRIDPAGLDPELQKLGAGLSLLGRTLSALDDLSHALSTSSELAAGAVLADGLMDFALESTDASDEDLLSQALQWLSHRGVKQGLLTLYSFRHALDHVRTEDVDAAEKADVHRPLALWILSERLTMGASLDGADRPQLEDLFKRAGLMPLEVFDAADLWRDLDERGVAD